MLYLKKTMVKSVIYLLFSYHTGYTMWHSRLMIYIPFGSYQTGYIMWHSWLMIYIPFGCASGNIHSRVKSISTLRYFPIYFILDHLFSTHSPEVIPCLLFMKFSALNPKINIVSTSYNFRKILFILFLMTWFKHKVRFFSSNLAIWW